jgi:hypothetical protein
MVWARSIDVTILRTELTANDHPAMEKQSWYYFPFQRSERNAYFTDDEGLTKLE